ncbi:hypothetical protein FPSE_08978 [Fusarium pseudograminearum CS3096]|uniref:F-box domain-containing protein n=1 Tax=Fusarium pseudograminearum (strain CS3096) TaxID=1028729 RepID=K3UGB7_FUSPC|nr:hypothetical protein FPSE_08978 [Fusarium pseudograminearum CS3096]EKJ70826.1 hypothetical protein FPSE_08978 [Fusarium pseudograminearum CS3096]
MSRQYPITSFQGLPHDIYFEISKFIGVRDCLRLAATTRDLHEVFNPKTILRREQVLEFVTERDENLRWIGHDLYACTNCLQFLPKRKFVDSEWFYVLSLAPRFCLDCTGALRLRPHLELAFCADSILEYYFCNNCGGYGTESARCYGERIYSDTTEAEAAMARTLCIQPRRQPQGIEKLPTHILATIASFLDFKDVLNLTRASTKLNDVVKPKEWVPLHKRYAFVAYTWFRRVQDLPFDEVPVFPCLICCKIYFRFRFSETSLERIENHPEKLWKTYCDHCRELGSEKWNIVSIEQRRRELCQACGCVKYKRKTCEHCRELYIEGAIDRKTVYPPAVEIEEILPSLEDLFTTTCRKESKEVERPRQDMSMQERPREVRSMQARSRQESQWQGRPWQQRAEQEIQIHIFAGSEVYCI